MADVLFSDLRHHDDDVNGFVRAAHALMKQVNVSDGRHVGEAGDVPTRRTDDASNMTQVDNDVSYVENQGNRDLHVLSKMSPSSKDLCYWFRAGCKDGYRSVQCPALFFENHKKKLDVMSAFLEDNAEHLNFMIRRMNRLVMGHVRLLREEIRHFLSDALREKRANSERQPRGGVGRQDSSHGISKGNTRIPNPFGETLDMKTKAKTRFCQGLYDLYDLREYGQSGGILKQDRSDNDRKKA